MTPFEKQLAKNIRAAIRKFKREGVVSASLSCLEANTVSPSCCLEGAPSGPNAGYYYSQIFESVARQVALGFISTCVCGATTTVPHSDLSDLDTPHHFA